MCMDVKLCNDMKPKVSVIIPIFGVEKFIGRCVDSLMRQTLATVEYIFVNDATCDKSMDILKEVLAKYPNRTDNVRVITHNVNKGLPAARNTGLTVAQGEYIFHCDSDDYVEPDMLRSLYEKAESECADIVWCDWYLTFSNKERYMKSPNYPTAKEALRGMLSGAMKYNVWNKLVKHNLYIDHNILFPSGYGMGEDMTMICLMAHTHKVAYVPKAFYHYVKTNSESFCQTYSERHLLELRHNVEYTATYIGNKYGEILEKEIAFLKLESKFTFLISDGCNGEYHRWSEWFPEANRFIMQNRYVSLRSRLIQWCAWHQQYWLVWLYYKLIIQPMYKFIYK